MDQRRRTWGEKDTTRGVTKDMRLVQPEKTEGCKRNREGCMHARERVRTGRRNRKGRMVEESKVDIMVQQSFMKGLGRTRFNPMG